MPQVTKAPQALRYTILVDYEGRDGFRGQHQRWENTKNRAFLSAAYLVGLVRAQGGDDMKINIVDGTTGQEVHKPGDDLFWLY